MDEQQWTDLMAAVAGPLYGELTRLLREARAEAWTEGYEAGKDSEVYSDSPENPYRD